MSLSLPRLTGWFLLAVLITAVTGSLVQTQFNLAAITRLGLDINPGLRLGTNLHDLSGFGLLFAAMAACALAPALALAALLSRRLRHGRPWLFALAGALALLVTFSLVDALAPMPTLIAATRSLHGSLAMAATGALGAWVFARGYYARDHRVQGGA